MTLVHDITFETTNSKRALAFAKRYVYRTFRAWQAWSADVIATTDTHITVRLTVTA